MLRAALRGSGDHRSPKGSLPVPQWLVDRLDEAEDYFARKLPGSLCRALHEVADRLAGEPLTHYGPAIADFRHAAHAAFNNDLRRARDYYTKALAHLDGQWHLTHDPYIPQDPE